MSNIEKLIYNHPHHLIIQVNEHLANDESIESYLNYDKADIDEVLLYQMYYRNSVIRIQYYPENNIGFYLAFHYEIEEACENILNQIENDTIKNN